MHLVGAVIFRAVKRDEDVIPQPAQKTEAQWIEAGRKLMSTLHDGEAALEVDPGCTHLILALGGGLVARAYMTGTFGR